MNQEKRSAECFKRGDSSPTWRSGGILTPFRVKVFVNARFTYPKLKKCRTKSVDLRHPSFGISFDSRGKRNFFPKPLFFIISF